MVRSHSVLLVRQKSKKSQVLKSNHDIWRPVRTLQRLSRCGDQKFQAAADELRFFSISLINGSTPNGTIAIGSYYAHVVKSRNFVRLWLCHLVYYIFLNSSLFFYQLSKSMDWINSDFFFISKRLLCKKVSDKISDFLQKILSNDTIRS